MLGADEGGELAEAVAQADVDALAGLEAEFLLQDAQLHDTDGHNGRLGVRSRCQNRVGTLGDGFGQGGPERVVHVFEKGFADAWERF